MSSFCQIWLPSLYVSGVHFTGEGCHLFYRYILYSVQYTVLGCTRCTDIHCVAKKQGQIFAREKKGLYPAACPGSTGLTQPWAEQGKVHLRKGLKSIPAQAQV